MAILNNGDFPIDPNTTTGTDLADRLNRQLSALASSHSNSTRPTYLTAGAVWTQPQVGGGYKLFFYDGTTDHEIGSVDASGNAQFGGGLPLALEFNPATSYTTGNFIYDAATGGYLEAKNNNGPGAYNPGDWQAVTEPLGAFVRKSGDTMTGDLTVGVGTAGAAAIVNINGGNTASNGPAIIGKSAGAEEWLIGSLRAAAGSGLAGMVDFVYGNNPRVFYTNGVERMRVEGTGGLKLAADPTDDLHATTKQYVDARSVREFAPTHIVWNLPGTTEKMCLAWGSESAVGSAPLRTVYYPFTFLGGLAAFGTPSSPGTDGTAHLLQIATGGSSTGQITFHMQRIVGASAPTPFAFDFNWIAVGRIA